MFFFLQTHEDVRNFLCPHEGCGKSFKRLLHLKEHSAIHLGEHRPKVPYRAISVTEKINQVCFDHVYFKRHPILYGAHLGLVYT